MFGLISKKKVYEELEKERRNNRKESIGAFYGDGFNKDTHQLEVNMRAQAWEDATDNVINYMEHCVLKIKK